MIQKSLIYQLFFFYFDTIIFSITINSPCFQFIVIRTNYRFRSKNAAKDTVFSFLCDFDTKLSIFLFFSNFDTIFLIFSNLNINETNLCKDIIGLLPYNIIKKIYNPLKT